MRTHTEVPSSVYGVLILGLMSFSMSPILVRLAGDAPSVSLVVLRTFFSIVLLAPFAIAKEGKSMLKLSRREIGGIVLAGVLLGVHFYIFFEAIRLTTVASATVFVSLTPIFLGILGYLFLKERLSIYVIIGIFFAVLGGLMIGYGDSGEDVQAVNAPLGNMLALIGCLMVSVYLLIGRVARQNISWLAYIFPLYAVASLSMIIVAVLTDAPILGLDLHIYGWCLLMAIFPQIIGHGSFNFAIKFLPAAILGLLSLTEPIGSTILAYLLFDELPSTWSFIGMGVTLKCCYSSLAAWFVQEPERGKSFAGKS